MENAFFDHDDNNSNKKTSMTIIGDKAMAMDVSHFFTHSMLI